MKKEILFQMRSTYRDDFRIEGYRFGSGEKTMCIVGPMRGDEVQQQYICSQIVRELQGIESDGGICDGRSILVIPSCNPFSMNVGRRFWAMDGTDINRMFPGYDQGETTQRIAAGVFNVINKYRFGVQFSSFYSSGEFQPHVRIMHTGYENLDIAQDFGLPYIVLRQPRPYDTTTLNYNWQIWGAAAYSLYSATTSRLDMAGAEMVVDGIERFMIKNGILTGEASEAAPSRLVRHEELINLRTTAAGFYRSFVEHNARVHKGQALAEITDPCTGEVLETMVSPVDGVIFFQHAEPMIYAFSSALKLLADE